MSMRTWKKQKIAVEFLSDRRTCETLSGKIARNNESENAIELECHYNYNGSGKQAFGGAIKWPVITLNWAFQEGEETHRDVIARRLKKFVLTPECVVEEQTVIDALGYLQQLRNQFHGESDARNKLDEVIEKLKENI